MAREGVWQLCRGFQWSQVVVLGSELPGNQSQMKLWSLPSFFVLKESGTKAVPWILSFKFSSNQCPQFSLSVMSDSLRPHGLQHTRLPCLSPTPWACSNSSPSSQWCHPTISSSVVPFSFCPQFFPASGSFPMSQFFTSGGQSIEFQLQHQSFQWIFGLISLRIDWLDLLAVQGTLKSLFQHHSSKASILRCSAFFMV